MTTVIQARCSLCDKKTNDYSNPMWPLCRTCESVHMAFKKIAFVHHLLECDGCRIEGTHPDNIFPCRDGEPFLRRWREALMELQEAPR